MDESSRRKTEFIPHSTEKRLNPEQLKTLSDKYENQTKGLLQQYHQNLQNLGIAANPSKNVYETKMQNLQEKNQSDIQTIDKLRQYISKQKQQVQGLKEELKKIQLQEKELIENFDDVNDYQHKSYENICTIKSKLNDLQNVAEKLKKRNFNAKKLKLVCEEKIDQLRTKILHLQEEKAKFEYQAAKQVELMKSSMLSCEQTIKAAEEEKFKMQKLLENEIQKHQQENELRLKVEKNLNELKDKYKSFLAEEEKMKTGSENLIRKLDEEICKKKREVEVFTIKTEALLQKSKEIESTIKKVDSEIKNVEQLLEHKENEFQQILEYSVNFKQTSAKRNEMLIPLQNNLKLANEKLADTSNEISKLEKNYSHEIKQIHDLETQFQEKCEKVQNVIKEINEQCKITVKNDEDLIRSLEDQLKELKLKKEALSLKLTKEKELKNCGEVEILELETKIEKLEAEIKELEEEIGVLTGNNQKLLADNKLQKNLQKEIVDFQKKVEKSQTKCEDQKTAIDNFKSEIAVLLNSSIEAENKTEVIENECAATQRSQEELKKEYNKVQEELQHFKSECTAASNEKKDLDISAQSDRENQLKNWDGKISEMNNEQEKLRNEKAEIQDQQKAVKQLETESKTLDGSLAELLLKNTKLQKLEEELNTANEKHNKFYIELTEKRETHKEIQKQLTQQKKQLKESKLLNRQLEKNHEMLLDKVTNVENDLHKKCEEESKLKNNVLAFKNKIAADNLRLANTKFNETTSKNFNVPDFSLESMVDTADFNLSQNFDFSFQNRISKTISTVEKFENLLSLDDTILKLEKTKLGQEDEYHSSKSQKSKEDKSMDQVLLDLPSDEVMRSNPTSPAKSSRKSILNISSNSTAPVKFPGKSLLNSSIQKRKNNKFIKSTGKSVKFAVPIVTEKTPRHSIFK